MAQPIWQTKAGSLGTSPGSTAFTSQLIATPVLPATSVTYAIISGSLPIGLSMNTSGLISGTTSAVTQVITNTFVVRATDNLNRLNDRTFSITVSGSAVPSFVTPPGQIAQILDSTWTSIQIEVNNPSSTNDLIIHKIAGILPPGLEINDYGLIRGYAKPPINTLTLPEVNTIIIATNNASSTLTCLNTAGLSPGRPITFSGTVFGGVITNHTYYVKSVVDGTTFTISNSVNGSTATLSDATGAMTGNLPPISYGQPTIRSYNFTLQISSLNGTATQNYSILVTNQNTPVSQGGPGYPPNNRIPAIYNTRPETYQLDSNPIEYGYYVLPPNSTGNTYAPTSYAYIGSFSSGDNFNFKILGHDFDGDILTYNFSTLPLGLVGDSVTGWITGTPVIAPNSASQFNFSVSVSKSNNLSITSDVFYFSFDITNNILGDINWLTDSSLGTVYNGSTSLLSVLATCDVALEYRVISGTLPPNLTLLSSGELSGVISYQPMETLQNVDTINTFTFTIQAYSALYPIIHSEKTFTVDVLQYFEYPLDTLYCKCTPSIDDRYLINSLLLDDTLIPSNYLYRSTDPYYGKATDVVYEHAYGINANDVDAYIDAIKEKNHYWRNITLGEIKTAIARDENTGEILYEVVYSSIYDNLMNYNEYDYQIENQSNIVNPQGESVAKRIYWPRPISLYPKPGYARILYPNSLVNMRQQVVDVLGQEANYHVLPLWMTSQQRNGSTLGFTPAWVIAYCKPGVTSLPDGTTVSYAEYIKYQIENNWKDAYGNVCTLNTINFQLDRFTVNKSVSYDYDNTLQPPSWTELPGATPPPDPLDSKDFYVLFPRKTILPDDPQF